MEKNVVSRFGEMQHNTHLEKPHAVSPPIDLEEESEDLEKATRDLLKTRARAEVQNPALHTPFLKTT
ncbi:hypothetical protein SUGI_1044430 [Cryptomeria japonica]|nr:hypothetical protein SUGI_1044430 [Cryptomeria japonica]